MYGFSNHYHLTLYVLCNLVVRLYVYCAGMSNHRNNIHYHDSLTLFMNINASRLSDYLISNNFIGTIIQLDWPKFDEIIKSYL